jgi:hypothetical protein
MAISVIESQAAAELANHLYPFFPGKSPPRADQATSFEGVAKRLGFGRYIRSRFLAGFSKAV